MQIWIFFVPGTGGDSLANFFEQSPSCETIDGKPKHWRVHRYVDGLPKFYAPRIDLNGAFRQNFVFSLEGGINQLRPEYVEHVTLGHNVVCTSHDVFLEVLNSSDCQDLLTRQQYKILIDCHDTSAAYDMANKKLLGLATPTVGRLNLSRIQKTQFDLVLDFAKFVDDWTYAESIMSDLCMPVAEDLYHEWSKIVKGQEILEDSTIEHWKSCLDSGGQLSFSQVDLLYTLSLKENNG